MESSKLNEREDDSNMSTFRRRNKILILVLIFLIISLTLTLATLVLYLLRLEADESPPDHRKPPLNPALQAFCHVSSDAAACSTALKPVISRRFVLDPNQIFALSLQAAAAGLQHSIASLTDHKIGYGNCSDFLRVGLDRIRDPIAAMRVDPFVESRSEEERGEMVNRITAAEEDVEMCLDDLEGIGGDGEAKAELVKVRVYLNGAGDFVMGYAEVLQMLEADSWAEGRRSYEYLFGVCLFGSPLLFIIALFCSLFRIKSTAPKF